MTINSPMSNRPELSGLTITLEIIKARNLVAKDRNIIGKRTTSDPYVTVHIGDKKLGKTKMVAKTLNPCWNETFQHKLGADSAAHLLQPIDCVDRPVLIATLTIWDYDRVGTDDPMGTVKINLNPFQSETTQWYPVGKGAGKNLCKDAKGGIQVKISFEGNQMLQISRGQAFTLSHNRIRVGLAWDVERGQKIDLDSSCVVVDHDGQVLMEESVYYGNLTNTNLAIQHSGDELTGEALGDDEKIILELDRMPSKVLALYFLLTVATSSKTFADVKSARARFIATESREGICRYVPHIMGGENTSLFLCRIVRQGSSWVLTPIEEGDKYARDFGSLIPAVKGYTRDLVPSLVIDPNERVAIMRKGGTIRVSDYVPGGIMPTDVSFGLSWDITKGVNIDLDASAVMLGENLKLRDIVYFKQLTSKDGSIRHSGDEREGDESGDDEILNISLLRVSSKTKYIGFVVNSFSEQELDDVDKAACHLYDPKTKADIATFTLTDCREVDKHTALVMACLYRGDIAEDWYLTIIALPAQGKYAKDNVRDLQSYLKKHPPRPPAVRNHHEAELNLSMMPNSIPVKEKTVVVPQDDFKQYAILPDNDVLH